MQVATLIVQSFLLEGGPGSGVRGHKSEQPDDADDEQDGGDDSPEDRNPAASEPQQPSASSVDTSLEKAGWKQGAPGLWIHPDHKGERITTDLKGWKRWGADKTLKAQGSGVLKSESWVDQGKKKPAGMKSTLLYTAQAMLAHAPLLRSKKKAVPPVDAQVPVASFVDDVKRKMKLKYVMQHTNEALPGRLETKEDVNYRYAENPERSCGKCTHFLFPGACDMVAGLIRLVDVCNEFEAKDSLARNQASPTVQATFVDSAKKEAGEGGPGSGIKGHVTDRPEGGGNGKPDGWVSDPMMKKELVSIAGQTHEIKMRTDKETGEKLMSVAGQDIARVRVTSEPIRGPVGNISVGSSSVAYVQFKPEGLAKLIGPERAAMFPTTSQVVKNPRGAKRRFSNLLTEFTRRGQTTEDAEGGPGSGPQKGGGPHAQLQMTQIAKLPPGERRKATHALRRQGLTRHEQSEEGGPGSGPRPGGKSIYAKPEPEGDEDRQIGTFTRREKPGERRDRIRGKKVDPATAKAIQKALLVVRASLVTKNEAMSQMGSHVAISDVPGSDSQDYTAPGLQHGRRGAA